MTSVSSIDTWTTTGSMISGLYDFPKMIQFLHNIAPIIKMSSHLADSSSGLEPHQQQNLANGLTIRRVSRAANGEVVYPCDFCDRYFTNRHHLSSHMVTRTMHM